MLILVILESLFLPLGHTKRLIEVLKVKGRKKVGISRDLRPREPFKSRPKRIRW